MVKLYGNKPQRVLTLARRACRTAVWCGVVRVLVRFLCAEAASGAEGSDLCSLSATSSCDEDPDGLDRIGRLSSDSRLRIRFFGR
jgi:hypothetical protein